MPNQAAERHPGTDEFLGTAQNPPPPAEHGEVSDFDEASFFDQDSY
jgi:hypothetical protein